MRTARRASNVEVPSFLRQLVRETEKMVTFFFKGGARETEPDDEENSDEDDSMPSPYLEHPILEKHVLEGGSQSGINYAMANMQGWRAQMEDAHTCMPQLRGELTEWGYFAVFDGHAGTTVARYCAKNLLDHILATGTQQSVNDEINLMMRSISSFMVVKISPAALKLVQVANWIIGCTSSLMTTKHRVKPLTVVGSLHQCKVMSGRACTFSPSPHQSGPCCLCICRKCIIVQR